MNRFKNLVSVFAVASFVVLGLAASAAAQKAPNERDVRNILRSLDSKVSDLRYSVRYGLRDSDDQASLENDVLELNRKVREFQTNFNQRRDNADDVLDILNTAKSVGDYLQANRVNKTVEKDWSEVRTLLDRLAGNYSVSWDWNTGGSNRNFPGSSNALVGTYRLDASRSENTRDIVDNANVSDSDRADLEDKLEPAETVAIDIRGTQVTLASSRASAVTFVADGRTRTENSGGRSIRVRAQLDNGQLTISSIGGDTDYTMIFTAEDGGRELKITRRVTTDYLNQTVFADSFYEKTDSVARIDGRTDTNTPVSTNDDTYSSNDPDDRNTNDPTIRTTRPGDYIVPNGTVISGILENDINTKISQNNDRFRLTVQSPNEFRGAVIDGYISGINRSGKVTGRSQITFNFERITLRNGESYDFAGYLQGITDQNGKNVKIDTEGTAKGDSQTKETVKRGGIGAGAGALIGAILGGAKGAAIGAIIGGGAGAGSVIVQGKDDLDLKRGSMITVQSSSPNR